MISDTFEERWEQSVQGMKLERFMPHTSAASQDLTFRISKTSHRVIETSITLLYGSGKFSNLLHLHDNYGFLYSNVLFGDINHTVSSLKEIAGTSHKWDLICGLFPMGARIENAVYESSIHNMLCALPLLSENGIGVFFLTPMNLRRSDIRKIIADHDVYLQAIIGLPQEFLRPVASVSLNMVIVGKKYTDHEFIAEIKHADDLQTIFSNYINNKNTESLASGIVQTSGSQTIPFYRLQEALSNMPSDYQNFPRKTLKDLSIEINACPAGKTFQEFSGSSYVYVPAIGTLTGYTSVEFLKNKHQNYYQIVVDREKIDPLYLTAYLESPIADLIHEEHLNEHTGAIPRLSKSAIGEYTVVVPPLQKQTEIASSYAKLVQVETAIKDIRAGLSLNPISDKASLDRIDQIHYIAGELTDADRVLTAIRSGESKTVEYKQTLSLDITKKTKEAYISDEVIKTIAGFLNTDGGMLLVGIADNGDIIGLGDEISRFDKTEDKFMTRFRNLWTSSIGVSVNQLINARLVDVSAQKILLVDCSPSTESVFVRDRDFYIRTNPATQRLEGQQMLSYIESRKAQL
ncbi:MAG: hypothetical protein CL788_01915 [Chloroflexi bacterium]|nr:hypothetical protein [Chloroflexota bacterium]